MAPIPVPWRVVDEGVALVVRVTPRGGRDALDGVELMADGRAVLKLRVRAAPADGEANAAVIKLLAATLKLRRGDIDITAGATARIKQVLLRGEPQHLTALLDKQCSRAIEETK
jgi:uncharacterized protein